MLNLWLSGKCELKPQSQKSYLSFFRFSVLKSLEIVSLVIYMEQSSSEARLMGVKFVQSNLVLSGQVEEYLTTLRAILALRHLCAPNRFCLLKESPAEWPSTLYASSHCPHKFPLPLPALLLWFSRSVMSNYFRPHELQHARPPCLSLSPGVCPSSCPLNRWCHPTSSSSAALFSSCLQCFPESGSFPMSWLFTSGGQSIGASASVILKSSNKTWSIEGQNGKPLQ